MNRRNPPASAVWTLIGVIVPSGYRDGKLGTRQVPSKGFYLPQRRPESLLMRRRCKLGAVSRVKQGSARVSVPTNSIGDWSSVAMEGFIVILNEVKNPNGRGKVSIPIQRLFPASVGILRRCIPQNDTQGFLRMTRKVMTSHVWCRLPRTNDSNLLEQISTRAAPAIN